MASTIELEASARPGVGKGAARQARRAGFVPGVVYGGNEEPTPINIRHNVLLKALKAGKFMQTLIKLQIDGKAQTVICRSVQRDVVKDLPTHADFLRLSEKSMVELAIPVHFINHEDSPGIKRGGVLTVVRAEVELKVRASNIPDELVVDLSGLDVSDVVRISDVPLPEGARPVITDRDFMIANISAPTVLKAGGTEDEDEGEAEAATEAEEG
ncbi:MAG TPA: 50S ribosomal protein L25/general stress protein Ctc [Paracoccaceae bacterium]|nr:50S ribosomal protein L25/general stress protein Ctc [Paracoccaceae bacterium]